MTSPRRPWLALPLAALVAFNVFVWAPPTGAEEAPKAVKAEPAAAPTPKDKAFLESSNAFLDTYCNKCHNSDKQAGGVPLDIYHSMADARKDRKMWESIVRVVANGEMPPKSKPQPKAEEKAAFLTQAENTLIKVDCGATRDAGRVTLRRLNRAEYNNTVRDLCGISFKPADDFPSDDVGYGFDNIGDVLSMPPILLEKYLTAADKVLDEAVTPPSANFAAQSFKPQNMVVKPKGARTTVNGKDRVTLTTAEGSAALGKFNFPANGSYVVRVRVAGTTPDGTPARASLTVDGKDRGAKDATAAPDKPASVEWKFDAEAGERRVAVTLANPSDPAKLAGKPARSLVVTAIEVSPAKDADAPMPASVKLILTRLPKVDEDADVAAKEVLAGFARRAFRRPVKPDELTRLMKLFDLAQSHGDPFAQAIKLPLKAILVSPHFLFRVEADPVAPATARTLSDLELASRLSYFLWSSMPDEPLLALAEKGQLRKPGTLEAQIQRMLKDPKSSALVDNFAGQWLQLRLLRTLAPDTETYKTFDEPLRQAMIRESEMFFDYVVRNDRSILEFLDADYTFVNDRLSWHYGIADIQGPEFRYVKLKDNRRGGLVTQASILTVTSNPTRTSPVKRGKWIYENILGLQPPPAAPDVGELPPADKIKGTLRQQMEQHRANPACASCHAKLDPLGFGLENFDGIGGYRSQDNKINVDASGVLPDGAKFNGPAELRKVLLSKSDLFRRCLAEKLLTFALGRGLEYYDKCVLDEIGTKVQAKQDKFSALVLAIVQSDAFQKRQAKRSE